MNRCSGLPWTTNAAALARAAPVLAADWRKSIADHARTLFEPVFDNHTASPQHLVAAHRAKGYLYGTLNKLLGKHPEPETSEATA